jgi:hypothetical protein
MVFLSGEDTRYIIQFFDLINFSVLWVALSENESLNPLLDVAGALTWAKLQLSLCNFNIMLPITRGWMGDCYSMHFHVWFIIEGVLSKHKNCDYSLNNERNFTKFLLYTYQARVHDISYDFFIRIICTAPHPQSHLAHPWIQTHSRGAYLANMLVRGTSSS